MNDTNSKIEAGQRFQINGKVMEVTRTDLRGDADMVWIEVECVEGVWRSVADPKPYFSGWIVSALARGEATEV